MIIELLIYNGWIEVKIVKRTIEIYKSKKNGGRRCKYVTIRENRMKMTRKS